MVFFLTEAVSALYGKRLNSTQRILKIVVFNGRNETREDEAIFKED